MKHRLATIFHRRRGVTLVLVAVTVPVLLICAALTIDVGYIYTLRAQVQNTADAAALAGTLALKESQYGAFQTWALDVITRNQESFGFLSLDDQSIQVGRWDKWAQTFTPIDAANASSANAVRVLSVRSNAPLFFAALMGKHYTTINREAIAMVTPSCNGVWGADSVTVPGSVLIDSFDSTSGPYDSTTANSNGDVCSNGQITVSGSADIYGDVLATDVILSGGAIMVSGVTEDSIDPVVLPPIDFGDVETNNDNDLIPLTDNGNVAFNPAEKKLHIPAHDNLTLPPGTYYMMGVQFDSPSTLTLTGTTVIYLTGSFDASGNGTINTTMNPADLTIYSSGNSLTLTGGIAFYGSIYAPNATIKLAGNADYYGAMVGRNVDFSGNFSFHVDESAELMNVLKGPVLLVR